MAINTAPQPSTCLVLDSDGRGTVLQVTSVHNLDGETLAERLYEAYAMTTDNNMELPDEITVETLMAELGGKSPTAPKAGTPGSMSRRKRPGTPSGPGPNGRSAACSRT
ncbi:hypothetical protein OG592_41030 (plasmid) [Streptomyces avidinii]|uniref:hypothetical protein n=1 Tax=Streptomyces avidinii TaxID=1895 RepID=UPI002F917882|nr:hypothetical protein OG592_41030 [Streptomyces avidinii]